MREIRVYMLTVACSACVVRIGMTIGDNFNLRMWVICAENLIFDLASRSWNCWWW